MTKASVSLFRLAALVCALLWFGLDGSTAFAQSGSCASLANTLRALDATAGAGGIDSIDEQQHKAQQDVRAAEGQYIQDGCNAAAKAGKPLAGQCKIEWNQILAARAERDQAGKLNAIVDQRDAVQQQMDRMGCDNGDSTASFGQSRRANLLEQIFGAFGGSFGGDGNTTRGDQFSGEAGYDTIRTVCVRKQDGYYWPISFSTLLQYAQDDLATCQQQCPGLDVDLYYYNNPGQDPDQMVNLSGQPYKSLPHAFAYRTTIDPALSCKPPITYGTINLADLGDGTQRAMISFEGASFPLPMADPRRPNDAKILTVAATYVDVPLPRPRPAAPGEAPKPVLVQQTAADTSRIVMFGDKRVRIVGPDTPYAPTGAAGT